MIKIKEGFKGERFISLPEELLSTYSAEPLIGNLYVRKIGFFPKVKFHYVQKNEGCNYSMLIYCTDGKGWYSIGGKTYTLAKNQYIILPPDTPYSFGANDNNPWTIYWLHFRGKLSRNFLHSRPDPISILPGDDSRLQDRIQLFEEIYSCFSMGYIKEYMVYSSLCLYMFLASFIYIDQYRHLALPEHTEISFSARVIRYMQENIGQNISLEQLATYFKYSPSHFSMLFQKETNVSPIHYFIQLKIQKACQYIELTNLKLNEIATKLGFEEPAYFSRIFTKIMGISPSLYRKREMGHTP
ncbi:AraC family transcriptional regulator [Parabacteroides pacaensis]|uniref:AraC family transcriptional regulator n=1 Tax=Parabacteroides pacaensis TaxID=2086575 RepID=UPI000D0F85FF|nr:AraC family transcriptional regulator [Parabacteroides pacaensis]